MHRLLLVAASLAIVACGSASASEETLPVTPGSSTPTPEPPFAGTAGGRRVRQIALGTIAACALLEDATVACYGGGIVGTLGRGDRPEIDPVPRAVPGLAKVARCTARRRSRPAPSSRARSSPTAACRAGASTTWGSSGRATATC